MALDWQDLWTRLRRMLWGAAVLGGAGLVVGLWIYGTTLDSWHRGMPAAYAELAQPNAVQEGIRVAIAWMRGWETVAMVLWVAAVVWLYLVPEVCTRRQVWAAAAGTAGMALGFLVDKGGPDWGASDQFVRFGLLLGAGCFLGIGWAIGERGSQLARRVLEGAVTGGVIGLLSVFGMEVAVVGLVPGLGPETQLLIPPVVWGLVVGWTITGTRECLQGPQGLGIALRQRWPLGVGVILVLVNSAGPVLVMQTAYAGAGQ